MRYSTRGAIAASALAASYLRFSGPAAARDASYAGTYGFDFRWAAVIGTVITRASGIWGHGYRLYWSATNGRRRCAAVAMPRSTPMRVVFTGFIQEECG
jgi:hypothetical protein